MRFQAQNLLSKHTSRAPNYGLHPSENLRPLPTDCKLRFAAMLDRIRWQATSSHTAFSPSVMHNLWIETDLIYAIYHAIWDKSILIRIILHEIPFETILIYDIWSAIWVESILICIILHEISFETILIYDIWSAIWDGSILTRIILHSIWSESKLTCSLWRAIWSESILFRIGLQSVSYETNWICFVFHAIWSETQSDLLIFLDQRPADGRGPTENTTPCEGEVWEL